jgi:hypothetical protein
MSVEFRGIENRGTPGVLAVDAINLAQSKPTNHGPKLEVRMKAIMRTYVNNEVEGQRDKPLIRNWRGANVVALVSIEVEGDTGAAG